MEVEDIAAQSRKSEQNWQRYSNLKLVILGGISTAALGCMRRSGVDYVTRKRHRKVSGRCCPVEVPPIFLSVLSDKTDDVDYSSRAIIAEQY